MHSTFPHSLMMLGWGLVGFLLAAAGLFSWSNNAMSRGPVSVDETRPIPPIDRKKPGKFETATFGMG